MEYLRIQDVLQANQGDIKQSIKDALSRLEKAQRMYPQVIMRTVDTGNLVEQIAQTYNEAKSNVRTSLDSSNGGMRLSDYAGPYFLNEDIIGGSREGPVLDYVNQIGSQDIEGWQSMRQKLKLGPGIGFIQAPRVYEKLLNLGEREARLSVNYTAPFGTRAIREGIKQIMDSKIDPEGSFFPIEGVCLTSGATEGIDLAMQAISYLSPGKRVVFLGLSYYTGPFAAAQYGLKTDRLFRNPTNTQKEGDFFPDPLEVEKAIPSDTQLLVLTIPNNPNGEIYSEDDMREMIKIAGRRRIWILYDCLFDSMYFNDEENYRSRFLQIAQEEGFLDRVLVVDGISKSKNFPGPRIGFLATTDESLVNVISNIVLSRRCNSPLVAEPLVEFEGLARQVKALEAIRKGSDLNNIIRCVFQGTSKRFNIDSFTQMYQEWRDWEKAVIQYYRDNLVLVREVLSSTGLFSVVSPDAAAFNTFVRASGLDSGTNVMDYLAKLMFTLAVYTQVGPCFGISQKVWDKNLGVWARITYACDRNDLTEALVRLVTFTRFYAEKNFGNPNRFPTLDICYEDQV